MAFEPDDLDVTSTDILDAWELLHHLRRFHPRATLQVLESADMSDERFDALIKLIPAHWDDEWTPLRGNRMRHG